MTLERLRVAALTFSVALAAGSFIDDAWPFGSGAVASVVFKSGFEEAASAVDLARPGNFVVILGESLDFTLSATTTLPGGVLQYARVSGPTALTVDSATGRVRWTPTAEDLGVNPVTASARDQLNPPDAESFQVEVVQPPGSGQLDNLPPTLAPLPDASVNVGETFSAQASGNDPENGVLVYSLVSAPDGMSIDSESGLVSFIPQLSQAGESIIGVRVRDPLDLAATQTFTLTVVQPNRPPVALDDGYELQRNDVLTVAAPGVAVNDTDPDGDSLTVSLVDDVQFGTLELASDGGFIYTPDDPVGEIGFVEGGSLDAPSLTGPTGPPLIADMNADGVTDVFTQLGNGVAGLNLFVISSPSTGEIIATSPQLDRGVISGSGKALADIDLDGFVEIISIGGENSALVPDMYKVFAFEHDGTFKWESEQLAEEVTVSGTAFVFGDGALGGAEPTIADLDQDGTPEILVGHAVSSANPSLNGVAVTAFDNQGMKLFTSYARGIRAGGTFMRVEVVDLDLDGDPEILVGSAAFSHTGEVLWALPGLENFNRRATPIAANLDGDPFPELVRLGTTVSETAAYNHDGSELWRVPTVFDFNTFSTELVVADVDDDGPVEILAVGNNGFSPAKLEVLNGVDGSLKWEYPSDGSGLNLGTTAPTVFDLDSDGDSEVILTTFQPRRLIVLDGADGSLVQEYDLGLSNASNLEIPIFADVDDDGAAELVYSGTFRFSPALSTAYWVFESPGDDWAPTRAIWNQWNYHVTNVNPDGTIPQFEQPHWLLPGLNRNRINNRLPEEREETFDQFTYRVSDGALEDEATAYLTILPGVQPRFVSTPDTTGTVGFPYLYAPEVVDPDAGESFTFSLVAGPPGMTIDPLTGLVRWTPGSTGEVQVGITVTDSTSLTDLQTFTLTIGEPVTVPDVVGLQQTAATTTLENAGLERGRIREVFDVDVAAGAVAAQSPPAGATAEFGQAVDLQVSLGLAPEDRDDDGDGFTDREGDCDDDNGSIFPGAGDSEGDDVDQNCDGVDGELALERIEVTPASGVLLSGERIVFEATGIRADDTVVNLTGLGTWSSSDPGVVAILGDGLARTQAAGAATVSLDYLGLSGAATVTVAGGVSSDEVPPNVVIASPVNAMEVTAPVPVIGTVTDANLLRWELSLAEREDAPRSVLATGTQPISDGELAQIDPTMMMNGLYVLSLTAFDRGGNVTERRTTVEIDGDYKSGNFTLDQEDLAINLQGLPISVVRSYDSRDKSRGDFGIGWRITLNSASVRSNRALGTAWEVVGGGRSFALVPKDEHMVSVTLPDGEIETFRLQITPSSSFLLPFTFLRASLSPVGDAKGTLTILDNANLAILGAQPGPVELLDDSDFDVFNPRRFRYVTQGGTAFTIDVVNGLEQVADTNGNTLTFSASGITHSSGKSVTFQRDSLGRIVELSDPLGNRQRYGYDGQGNLARHVDAEGNVTTFRYGRNSNLLEVFDPLGNRAVRNEYDDQGRLIAIVSPDGARIEFTSDIEGREELITDAAGNVTRLLVDDAGNVLVRERTVTVDGVPTVATEAFEYDEDGNEIVSVDADGVRTERSYDADGNVVQTVVDPDGLAITTRATWNALGQILTDTDAEGAVRSNEYDDRGNLRRATDASGNVRTFTNDANGRVLTSTDPLGTVTSQSYNASGALIEEEVVDASGQLIRRRAYTVDANNRVIRETIYRMADGVLTPLTTRFEYDRSGRMVRTIDRLGNVAEKEYDAAGRLVADIDPLGRRTEYGYDRSGRQVSTTFPDGTTTSRTYDVKGNLLTEVDELGRTTRYEYDELDRRVAVIRADGAREETVYSPGGRELATIDALGNRTDFEYDSAGRRIRAVLPEVVDARDGSVVRPVIESTLDAAGRLLSTRNANGNLTRYTLDILGRPIETTFADGASTRIEFDALSREVRRTDALGLVTEIDYDALGNVLRVIEPAPDSQSLSRETRYAWDLSGNRLTQTDGLGRTTRFEYDALNRQTRRILPDGRFAALTYDPVGNATLVRDYNGAETSVRFDVRNRLLERTFEDGSSQTFAYLANGLRSRGAGAAGASSRSYDERDRVLTLMQPDGSTLAYSYDLNGNTLTLATRNRTISHTYDALGRLASVTDQNGTTSYGYDLNGNMVRLTRPNGSTTVANFDVRDRVVRLEHRGAGGTVLERFDYSYRPNGQVSSVSELDGSVESYRYDDLGRLVEAVRTGSNPFTINYAYDLVGNRLRVERDGIVETFSYDENDRLLTGGGTSYQYDGNGNRSARVDAGAVTRYGWNAQNRLETVAVDGLELARFVYDVDGHRVRAERGGVPRAYLIDPYARTGYPEVIEELDGAGGLLAAHTFGMDRLVSDYGFVEYPVTDALGSVRGVLDSAAALSGTSDYLPFGKLNARAGSISGDYGFAGEQFEEDTGEYYLRARYYDPALGMFLGRDPFPGRVERPATLHPYLYAAADPLNLVDPSGLEFTLVGTLSALRTQATLIGRNVAQACGALAKADTAALSANFAALGLGIVIGGVFYASAVQGNAPSFDYKISLPPGNKLSIKEIALTYSRQPDGGDKSGFAVVLGDEGDVSSSVGLVVTQNPDGSVQLDGELKATFEKDIASIQFCKFGVGKVSIGAEFANTVGGGTGAPGTAGSFTPSFANEGFAFLGASVPADTGIALSTQLKLLSISTGSGGGQLQLAGWQFNDSSKK